MARLIGLVLIVAALVAPAAGAAQVTFDAAIPVEHEETGGLIVGLKGAAADDRLTVAYSGDTYVLGDATAPLAMDPNSTCARLDDHQVRCSGRATRLVVQGGDGNDALTVTGAGYGDVSLYGGDGDDVLVAGSARTFLDGGPGADTLTGGPAPDMLDGGLGPDVVAGGAGDDEITEHAGDAGGRDRLGGDDGVDTLALSGTPGTTTVADLGAGSVSGGTTAALSGLESVSVVSAPQTVVLLGDDGPNTLLDAAVMDGRGGDDTISVFGHSGRLTGGPGDDVLTGAAGSVLEGGPGDDRLVPNGGTTLAGLACGDGEDHVDPAGRTPIPSDCERAELLYRFGTIAPPRLGRATLAVPLSGSVGPSGCGVLVQGRTPAGRALTATLRVRREDYNSGTRLHLVLTRRGVTGVREVVLHVASAARCPRRDRWVASRKLTDATRIAVLPVRSPARTASARATRCRARPHEKTVASSARYVVLLRTTSAGQDATEQLLLACDRRHGTRVPVGEAEEVFDGGGTIVEARIAGTRIAYVTVAWDKYSNDALILSVGDVDSPAEIVASLDKLDSWALSPRGDLAWTVRGQLWSWQATGRATRVVDEGFAVDHLRFDARGTLTWLHDGAPRSLPRMLPAKACPSGAQRGTREIDDLTVHKIGDPVTRQILCWRATGRTTNLPPDSIVPALAGPYAALATPDVITRYDLRDGTATSIAAPQAFDVHVDEAGDVAWRQSEGEGQGAAWATWVHDALGTHRVGAAAVNLGTEQEGFKAAPLLRDGSALSWGPAATDKYTMVPGSPPA